MVVVAASSAAATTLELQVFADRDSATWHRQTQVLVVRVEPDADDGRVRSALSEVERRLSQLAGVVSVTISAPSDVPLDLPATVVRREVIERVEDAVPRILDKAGESERNALAALLAAVGPVIPRAPPKLRVDGGLVRFGRRGIVGFVVGAPDVDAMNAVLRALPSPITSAEVWGQLAAEHALQRRLVADLRRAGLLGIGLVLVGLALMLGNARAPLLVLAPTLLAMVSTAGLLGVFGSRFSPVAWASGVVLVGLGIDYALHVIFEREAAQRRGASPARCLIEARQRTTVPIRCSALTTAGAFAGLYLSPIAVLHQLATVFIVGLAFVVLYTHTLLPSLLTLELGRLRLLRELAMHHRHRLLNRVAVVALFAALVSAPYIQWASAAELDLLRKESSLLRLHRLSVEIGASLTSQPLVSTGRTLEEAERNERAALVALTPWAGPLGIAFIDAYTQWRPDPGAWDALQARLKGSSLLNPDTATVWSALSTSAAGARLQSLRGGLYALRGAACPRPPADRYLRSSPDGVQLVARIHVRPQPWGTPPFAGFFERAQRIGVPREVIQRIAPDRKVPSGTRLVLALGASLGWVVLILLVQFRSLWGAVLCLVPVAVGFAAAVTASVIAGLAISPLTLPGWCLIAGVGVDDSIHVLHRLRVRDEHPLEGCAPAMVSTTLTTILALAGFAGTSLPGLYDFAVVAAAGLAGALVAALGPVPWLFARGPSHWR